ncbi:MAG TPA: alkaline phosphatase family protein [Candidatus Dormibacteraeota bacterium]|nr:alkaline phosphatase family protein [Candidatus Dormibacteraeota bacterium]
MKQHLRRSRLLLAVLLLVVPTSLFAQCGVERWSVKTGTDPDAGLVNLNSPTNTTIAALRAPAAPNPIPANNRVSPWETTEWILNATLTLYKLESDSDYHLVLQDAGGLTMIVEIPSPTCVGAGSPFFAGIQNARSEFNARFTATTSFQTANIPVQIKGVGMFDFLHGQTGVAPNGIELHPVLDVIFNPGATADFSVSAAPTSLSVTQGNSGSTSITTAISGGFNSAVSFTASGLPAGVTASFSPSSVAAPGSGSSTLTFNASSTATTGTSNITVTASGGGVTHTALIALTISPAAAPNFTVSASPASLSVIHGSSGSTTISTSVSGGFNSAVSLSASGLPTGVTASFSPASIAAPGGGNSTLTFNVGSTAISGTSTVTVTASGGGVTHTANVSLTVPQTNVFGIAPPDHLVIVIEENHSFASIIGSSSAPYINSLAQQGALFTQSFGVEHPSQPNYLDLFSGSNQGVTDDTCPHSFSTENLASELAAASQTFTGFSEDLPSAGSTVCTSGAYAEKHAPWVNFTNVPATSNQPFTSFPTDFTNLPTVSIVDPNLNDDMHDGTIAQGDTWLQQHIDSYVQFAQTHNSLLIVTWDEDDSASGNHIATIFVGPMVKQGQFAETINHFNVLRTVEDLYGLTHIGGAATATAISDVWKQPTADFTVVASPASLSVTQGSSGSSTVSTTVSGGFNSAVTLSASGLPAGVTASFNPASIAAPGGGSSTLTLSASSTATTGTANITITATGGSVTHTTTIALTVNSAASPDFAVSVSPASLSVTQGSSGSSTVSTTVSGGFNSAVSLSASGLPAGVTATFNPTSIAAPGSGSSTLTFSASSTATTGTANITITATGGTVTHTTSLALTVSASGGGSTTTQVLGNPGFENGSTNPAPWTATASVISNSTSEPAHSGTWKAWLDGYGATHTDTLMQQVAIASNATAATLTFWLHIDTAETSTTTAFDTLALQIRNSSGTVLSTLKTFSNLDKNTGFAQQTFDLTSFKGQTIQINFVGTEDASLQTSFVLDDFALNVTAPASDTTPPTTSITSPANGATVSGTTTINATASDNVGVTQIQILIDGAAAASNTNATSLSFSWNTTTVANGSHTIVSKAFDASGNVGTSSTVTVTVSNGGGTITELIGNGGFENGAASPAPWVLTSTHTPLSIINNSATEPPHSGTFDAWMNGWGTTTTDTVMQQVTIPANATAASFTFWLHINTAETSTTTAFDTLQVQIRNSAGTVLQTLATFSNLNHNTGYQQQTFNVLSFAGQTIQVFFIGKEDSSLQTSFVLDDISLKVTQ